MATLAVIVTFGPELDRLAAVIGAAAGEADALLVVENGSAPAIADGVAAMAAQHGAGLIKNPVNLGIAAAQNQGIEAARAGGYSHVLLLDQDTVLRPGLVAGLHAALADGAGLAAVGPVYVDANSGKMGQAVTAGRFWIRRRDVAPGGPAVADFIIASGSLIPLVILDRVGPFAAPMFIDLVDVEWCFRARSAGFCVAMVPTVPVDHRLGLRQVIVGRRGVPLHSPLRNYYWVRNAVWLAKRRATPWAWKLFFMSRVVLFLAVYPIVGDARLKRLGLMLKGIGHGLVGRLGPA